MTKLVCGVGFAVLVAACASSTGSTAPLVCKIGSLTGAWRASYVEVSGTCGPVADERVIFPAPGSAPTDAGPDPCTYAARDIAPDHCRADADFTCPLIGVSGTQHWVSTMHQTSATTLEGPWTLQVVTRGTTCRSSYDVTWTQE